MSRPAIVFAAALLTLAVMVAAEIRMVREALPARDFVLWDAELHSGL